jgi:hypothetical protein
MVLKDLLAIAGSPGLYKFIAQGKNAVIVEHLETGKRTSAHGAARVSSLEDISVFTDTEEVPLAEVFDKIYEKENGAASINHKSSPEELKDYFSELIPEYDRERVYVSDIKKIIQWYNILHSLDMLEKEEAKENEAPSLEKTRDEKEPVAKSKVSSPAGASKNKKTK